MAWLGEELPEKEQDGRTPFSPRCLKDVVEERLFAHRRDLLTRLDLVFMDTTSLYFEGAGGQTLGEHGYSKDHRPDLRQMILAVLLDGDGRPVCSEMWPGNTADVTTLIPVIDRLRRRFAIARVCAVADRGMISAETVAELEARRLLYILGVRERSDKLVRELVLEDAALFVPLAINKRGKQTDYEAKTVMLAGRRYIVCRNHQEAEKDAADRASIVAALERQLAKGDKALVGNTGYRRYLKTISDQHFAIDPDKIAEDNKFDGIFVLRTNTDLNPLAAMLCYKQCGRWSRLSAPPSTCSRQARGGRALQPFGGVSQAAQSALQNCFGRMIARLISSRTSSSGPSRNSKVISCFFRPPSSFVALIASSCICNSSSRLQSST